MRTVLLLLVATLGAGCGTLLGAEGLRRIDSLSVPRNLAWELRWLGPDGLVGQCELLPLTDDAVDLSFLPFAEVDLLAPQPGAPPVWRGAVAIAVPVAVTRSGADITQRSATAEAPLDSVFGAATAAWVQVDGDPSEAEALLGVTLRAGGQWRQLLDPLALVEGPLDAALADTAPEDLPWLFVPALSEDDPAVREILEASTLPRCGVDE